jgi:hypothetical protein
MSEPNEEIWTDGYTLTPCKCGGEATIDESEEETNDSGDAEYRYGVRCVVCGLEAEPVYVYPHKGSQKSAIARAVDAWEDQFA